MAVTLVADVAFLIIVAVFREVFFFRGVFLFAVMMLLRTVFVMLLRSVFVMLV